MAGLPASRRTGFRPFARLVDDDERARGLVRHQDVDAAHLLARLHFFAHEVPPLIIARFAAAACAAGRIEPRRRERAAQASHA